MSKPENNLVRCNCLKTTRKRAIDPICGYCMGVTSSLQGTGLAEHQESRFRTLIRDCSSPAWVLPHLNGRFKKELLLCFPSFHFAPSSRIIEPFNVVKNI